MIESTDFEELFELLTAHEVRYLVIGGYAVAVHARPRYTDDLDLLIDQAPDNVARLCKALDAFGFGPPELVPESFKGADRVVQLGIPPFRVDILTSIPGVDFEPAWQRRFEGRYGAQSVTFIGRSDLIMSKEAAARPKDLEDLRVLRLIDEAES